MERNGRTPKREGYSPFSFFSLLTFVIIVSIALLIVLVLFFRSDASKINPANCPEQVTGILVTPQTQISTTASNCGAVPTCTYTVNSLKEAVDICTNLGPAKCAAFSLEQQPLSNMYTLTISDSTATDAVAGSDTYRILL